MSEHKKLRVILPLTRIPAFNLLLQQGVWLRAEVGCSVSNLLTEQFGIDQNYIIERITTLFMDGKPIDDVEASYVNDGSTVALSSAMPRLVGVMMRRGGHLAAMRGTITHQSHKQEQFGIGRVKIKLFNMVMTELGASFLSQGILLSCSELQSFLSEQGDIFWQDSGGILWDGHQIALSHLKKNLSLRDLQDEIFVRFEFTE